MILQNSALATKLEILAPVGASLSTVLGSSAALPFSEDAIRFVQGFSKEIFANRNLKQFPEIIALAHWMRKANILTLKQKFESETTERFSSAVVLPFT